MDVYDLLNRDERLEMKLQALTNSTIVPTQYEEMLKFPKNLDEPPLYLTPEDLNMRDLGIEEQLQKISRNSIKEVAGWKPSVIKSHVTEEMIKEYQDEMHKKHYEDPITGRKFRYVPGSTDIDLEVPTLNPAFTDDELLELRTENTAEAEEIVRYTEILQSLYEYRKNLMDFEIVKPSPYTKGNYKKEYEYYQSQMADRQYELERLVRSEEALKNEISKAEYHIEQNQGMIKDNTRILSENQAEQSRTDKVNRGLLQAKSDELMTLNRGRMNVAQGPNEPAEDYKQRLLDIGAETYDETTIIESARLRNVDRFKTSMKELFRDPALIDSLVKQVMLKENDDIYNYNKYMIPIKKNFLEVYGFNNKDLKTENIPDILDFFDRVIEKVTLVKHEPEASLGLGEMLARRRVAIDPDEVATPWAGRAETTPALPPTRKTAGLSMAEMLASAPKLKSKKRELAPLAPKAPSEFQAAIGRKELRRTASENQMTSALDMNAEELKATYNNKYFLATGKHLRANGTKDHLLMQLRDAGVLDLEQEALKAVRPPILVASGIRDTVYPKRRPFGKVALNPHQLYYDNILAVHHIGGGRFNGFQNTKVSDAFVAVLLKLLNSEPVSHQDFKMFNVHERELYDNLIHLAGLHKKVEHNLEHTRKGMKQRLELIEGEIGAGNTNIALKQELKQLLHKMAYGGMISHPQARAHLKHLTSHF